jgi:carbon starvation protein
MSTLLIAFGSFLGFIVAYHTYGRWLARKIFRLDPQAVVPSHQLRDDIDFVPTRKEVIFGHHFTSIAGTGPIVGPAIAVFWGWLPALLWVLFGCIFIGAVHDFGALVVSLRNRGQTVGEIAGRLIAPRARILFLSILFFSLTVVLAIFGLVIAKIFELYPESVLSVWVAMPMAIGIGFWVYRGGGSLLLPSLIGVSVLYLAVYLGAYIWPIVLPAENQVVVWTILLMVYCFFASVLPVWVLLQPRDFINSLQLVVALALLVLGILVAGLSGRANIIESAPTVTAPSALPLGALPILPFLFITIACGAVSGFHCLVSSGTSSKQVNNEADALYVGYGSMLLEGALAVIVILACCAGVGMGKFERNSDGDYVAVATDSTVQFAAWKQHYKPNTKWTDFALKEKVGAFVEGGANFLSAIGIPLKMAIAMIAVLVACFAATTLDTATRLQRYVIQELAQTLRIRPLTNKYAATTLAVCPGRLVGHVARESGRGVRDGRAHPLAALRSNEPTFWAGLAFLVTLFYLWRRNKPVWFIIPPTIIMLVLPVWGLLYQMAHPDFGWWQQGNYLLLGIGAAVLALQVWIVAEGCIMWQKARGVLEEPLPPLVVPATSKQALDKAIATGGRSC